MDHSTTAPANGFVARARKIYHPVGFQKGYNAILFIIFGGAMLGFTLARFEYLSFNGIFCNSGRTGGTSTAAPGECYYYTMPRYHAGIVIHLAGILSAGFLVVFQFVPAIRHGAIIYHKTAGHVIILLALVGIAGALMIADVAFGGALDVRAFVGLLAIISVASLGLAYYNIKRKQIDQHRAWMLRAWFYMGSIITLRIVQIAAATILGSIPHTFYTVQACAKLLYAAHANASLVYAQFPACMPANAAMTVDAHVVVPALFKGGSTATVLSALDLSFGTAAWLALVLHAVGVEFYLALTRAEALRLRSISYRRQAQLGLKNPGSAGLVPEKLGDAPPFVPLDARHSKDSAVLEASGSEA